MEKVEDFRRKLKEDPGSWEEKIFRFACDLGRGLAKEILEELDDKLVQEKATGIKVVGFKGHWLTTLSSDVRLKRRLYRDKDGHYRFLLDEQMRLDKGSHASPKMRELACWPQLTIPSRRWNKAPKQFSPGVFLIALSIIFPAR